MKETKTKSIPVREAYEPMELKVLKVSPEGVLCQSGGRVLEGQLKSYSGAAF